MLVVRVAGAGAAPGVPPLSMFVYVLESFLTCENVSVCPTTVSKSRLMRARPRLPAASEM